MNKLNKWKKHSSRRPLPLRVENHIFLDGGKDGEFGFEFARQRILGGKKVNWKQSNPRGFEIVY